MNTFIIRFCSEGSLPKAMAIAARLMKDLLGCEPKISNTRLRFEVRQHRESGFTTEIFVRADLELEEIGELLTHDYERPSEARYLLVEHGISAYNITKLVLEQYGPNNNAITVPTLR